MAQSKAQVPQPFLRDTDGESLSLVSCGCWREQLLKGHEGEMRTVPRVARRPLVRFKPQESTATESCSGHSSPPRNLGQVQIHLHHLHADCVGGFLARAWGDYRK